ncbi:hypothetical protein JD844_027725, partial [Phrynosoma platyrhinos]
MFGESLCCIVLDISVISMNLCFQFKSIVFLFILDIQQSKIKVMNKCTNPIVGGQMQTILYWHVTYLAVSELPLTAPVLRQNNACQLKKYAISVQIKSNVKKLGTDCTEIIAKNPDARSGVYMIKPIDSPHPFLAFCENRADGGWTVIQRRNGKGVDGNPLNFYKQWTDYQKGFGDVRYEHWLGLDYMHALTNQPGKTCELRVDMINCQELKGYALYDSFRIGSETEFYSLHLGNYRGNTGDAFRGNEYSGTQDGHPFSTYDNDNDDCDPCIMGDIAFSSCAENQLSAGWFSNCGLVDLNGNWHNQLD